MIHTWKAKPVEFKDVKDGYSLASNYYKCKNIKGVLHYKITAKGIWKLSERRLCMNTHNFMVYLKGSGLKLISEKEFENGDIR